MTQELFDKKMKEIKEQEQKFGIEIEIQQLIDKDHLDCTWYGGVVGTVKYEGYTIVIGAYGDIFVEGKVNGEEVCIKDKANSGRVYRELGSIIDDIKLNELMQEDNAGDYLRFENNNWFEFDLITPDKELVYLYMIYDNVLDGNLLECFENAEYYKYFVKMYEKERID